MHLSHHAWIIIILKLHPKLVQNAAARLLTRSCHITPVLASLHWLPVNHRIQFKVLVITLRALHGRAPVCLSDLLHIHAPSRSLRSADRGLLFPLHGSKLKVTEHLSLLHLDCGILFHRT